MSDQAAPGWYPVDQRTERWWDGTQWSDHQRPAGQGVGVADPVSDPTAAPPAATPYPYAGDAVRPPLVQARTQGPPLPYQPQDWQQPRDQGPPPTSGQPPQYFGQQPPTGYPPAYGSPAPKRSVGRTVAAVVVGIIGVVFTLAALSQIARNGSDGARGVGYVIGSLLIPAAIWTGFYFLVRRPRR